MKVLVVTNMGRFFTEVVGNGAVKDLDLRHHLKEEVVAVIEVKP